VRGVRDGGSGLIAFRCVQIPLVWVQRPGLGDFFTAPARDPTREARCSLSGSSTLRDRARKPIDGFVAGSSLAAMAGTIDRALRSDVTVRTEIAPDLGTFNDDPEELYFALLNSCRNSADAMPNGGAITVAARNVELSAGVAPGDSSRSSPIMGGMPEEGLSRASTSYLTTKAPGSGTGLELHQIQRFAEGRGSAVGIESERCADTLVRLLLRRVLAAGLPSCIVGAEIVHTPSHSGGVFHVVNPATAAQTS
jgi:signal transduction histidine kinase